MHKYLLAGCLSAFALAPLPALLAEQDDSVEVATKAAYMVPLAAKSLLTDVIEITTGRYVTVGDRGHILLSQDGSNWQQAQVPVQTLLTSVYFTDTEFGWAVGHDATILHTQDGGQSWQVQQFLPETDKPLMDVYFFDRLRGIAVGAYGMFFTTNNGGQTWEKAFYLALASEEDQEFLAELEETDPEGYLLERESVLPHFNRLIVSNQEILMVGEAGFVAISEDGGENWRRLEAFYNGSLFDIHRTRAGSLLVAGLRGNLFRSTDNGETWQDIDLPVSATLNSLFEDSAGRLFVTGNAGALLSSTDDGQSFVDHSQADGRAVLNGLAIADQILLVTEAGVKLTTINKSE